MSKLTRCWKTDSPLYIKYHDEEWGVPVHDDRVLFEFLVLEGFQAGLTWELVLKRREALRKAFSGFDPKKIAKYGDADVERLLSSPGMIRNRLKILASINNARCLLKIQNDRGSFGEFIWKFVDGKTIDHRLKSFKDLPGESEEAKAMSRELKKEGFKFVGPTICYALMQAVGMVNDHLVTCFKHDEIGRLVSSRKNRQASGIS